MATYRKKTFEVEAVQLRYENWEVVAHFAPEHFERREDGWEQTYFTLHEESAESKVDVNDGDWVVRTEFGYKRMTDDFFQANFEEVDA